jgi:hypothetical protein
MSAKTQVLAANTVWTTDIVQQNQHEANNENIVSSLGLIKQTNGDFPIRTIGMGET